MSESVRIIVPASSGAASVPSDNSTPPLARGKRVFYTLHRGPETKRFQAPTSPVESKHVHVREYRAANWFTASGVLAKRKMIERKGMPRMHRWRFVTLTIDPERFGHDPLAAYLAAKDHMRRFMDACRNEKLMRLGGKWAWKLEFQANGWPHWHLLHDRTAIYSEANFERLNQLWGLGRAGVEMVREDDFAYSFKYAFKPVRNAEDDSDEDEASVCAPAWFLDYYEPGKDGQKGKTFSRARFWQTSRGFYTGPKAPLQKKKEPKSCTVPATAREQLNGTQKRVQVVARSGSGRYLASAVVALSVFTGTLWTRVCWDALHGEAVGFAVNSFVCPAETITKYTQAKWKLKPVLEQNKLSLRAAARLHKAGVSFRTC